MGRKKVEGAEYLLGRGEYLIHRLAEPKYLTLYCVIIGLQKACSGSVSKECVVRPGPMSSRHVGLRSENSGG
jgi:hypothetical protein